MAGNNPKDWNRREEKGPLGTGYSERPNEDGGYHRTLWDERSNSRISWDDDRNGDYRNGSGHGGGNDKNKKSWDFNH